MPVQKKAVLVMFGGRSPEHDISVVTGLQVLHALDPELYDAIPLYVSAAGQWYTGKSLLRREIYIPGPRELNELLPVFLNLGTPGRPSLSTRSRYLFRSARAIEFDVAIPAFHGLIGEDGGIQGLLEVASVPYTGMRPLASAVFMDKAATKRMLAATGIPQLPYWEIKRPERGLLVAPEELERVLLNVTFPCCVKPSHLGSSIGVARTESYQELSDVLPSIFRFDDTAILEPFVENLVEYNVSVSRIAGKVRTSAIECPKHTSVLLDFKSKYLSGSKKGTGVKAPGQTSEGMLSLTRDLNPALSSDMEHKVRQWATTAFEHLAGTGVPRMDFLCNSATGELWLNEVNPCPGSFGYFLWEAAEKPLLFSRLLELLVNEALEIHHNAELPVDPAPADARLFPRR
jgi:D-alanine-D-alanine ligase